MLLTLSTIRFIEFTYLLLISRIDCFTELEVLQEVSARVVVKLLLHFVQRVALFF